MAARVFTVTAIASFFAHVKKTRRCWIWHNVRNVRETRKDRYGRFYVGKRVVLAHVYSWRLHNNGAAVPRGKLAEWPVGP